MIDYEDEDDAVVTVEQLGNVSALAEQLRSAIADVETKERELAMAKAKRRKIEEDLLPTAMHEAGIASFQQANGSTMKLKKELYMSVPKKNMPLVCEWLIGHDHGPLVRTNIAVDFAAGDTDRANQAQSVLAGAGINDFSVKQTVNTASLKALARELMEQGEDVPLKLMGGYEREFVEVDKG